MPAPLFPSFAAFPGPVAPPTPSVPVPLVALAGVQPTPVKAEFLALSPTQRRACEAVADAFAPTVEIWRATTMVSVIGTGPVPTFAPPYVPVGRSSGEAFGVPGSISGSGPSVPALPPPGRRSTCAYASSTAAARSSGSRPGRSASVSGGIASQSRSAGCVSGASTLQRSARRPAASSSASMSSASGSGSTAARPARARREARVELEQQRVVAAARRVGLAEVERGDRERERPARRARARRAAGSPRPGLELPDRRAAEHAVEAPRRGSSSVHRRPVRRGRAAPGSRIAAPARSRRPALPRAARAPPRPSARCPRRRRARAGRRRAAASRDERLVGAR